MNGGGSMKLLVPGVDRSLQASPGPLSDLEHALQGEHAAQAREQSLAALDAMEARLRSAAAAGLPPADYAVLRALQDACQAARETLTMPGRRL